MRPINVAKRRSQSPSVIDSSFLDDWFSIATRMGRWHWHTHSPPGSSDTPVKASKEQLNFNKPHPPAENALRAFSGVIHKTKEEIVKSRRHWDTHEPKMWSRASRLSEEKLTSFSLERDLVLVSSAATTYGTIVLGKIRIPGINDDKGEGFVHVRYVMWNAHAIRKARDEDLTSVTRRGLESMTHPTGYCRFCLLLPRTLLTQNPYQGTEDVIFHSIFTDEGNRDKDGHPTTWQAIQSADTPLTFFNE